jgi:hypothetical protein
MCSVPIVPSWKLHYSALCECYVVCVYGASACVCTDLQVVLHSMKLVQVQTMMCESGLCVSSITAVCI